MISKLLIIALFSIISINVSRADVNIETPAAPSLSKSVWQFSRAFCPVGCSDDVKNFLKKYVGTKLEISPERFKAPFLDECSGTTYLEIQNTSIGKILDELNKISASKQKITASRLKLRGKSVNNAIVYCKDETSTSTVARIISIEPKRLLMLYEEQSFIEFR